MHPAVPACTVSGMRVSIVLATVVALARVAAADGPHPVSPDETARSADALADRAVVAQVAVVDASDGLDRPAVVSAGQTRTAGITMCLAGSDAMFALVAFDKKGKAIRAAVAGTAGARVERCIEKQLKLARWPAGAGVAVLRIALVPASGGMDIVRPADDLNRQIRAAGGGP